MLAEMAMALGTWPWSHPATTVRVGCYNIRVDHDADQGKSYAWEHRRPLAAAAVAQLDCDLLLLQEPGPIMAAQLASDLGDAYRVAVLPCDPAAWAADEAPVGQRSDGNGFIWQPARVEMLGDPTSFWLSEEPASPDAPAWDASPFQRTCVEARFRHRQSGHTLHAFSAHFDHLGGEARIASARLVMARAGAAVAAASADGMRKATSTTVLLGGDFNTFPDSGGRETYEALRADAANARMRDIRHAVSPSPSRAAGCGGGGTVTGVGVCDLGHGGASWKGWPGERFCVAENKAAHGASLGQDASRFDHLFVSAPAVAGGGDDGGGEGGVCGSMAMRAVRTGVVGELEWAGASDHLPIVAEFEAVSLFR